jgi:hypothetical protein
MGTVKTGKPPAGLTAGSEYLTCGVSAYHRGFIGHTNKLDPTFAMLLMQVLTGLQPSEIN